MPQSPVNPRRQMGTPEWVFPWRPAKPPLFPKLLAFAIAGIVFAFLVTTVRVQVKVPEKTSTRKASVIFLTNDAQGRALTLRARDGGPFPSRFELTQWLGLPELEIAAMNEARFQPPPYVPVVEDLAPENLAPPLELAAKGERFFPKRESSPPRTADSAKSRITPVLYPLTGVTQETLPRDLPPFRVADQALAAAGDWRFLVRLNPDGSVAESVSLEKGGEPDALDLAAWLHRIVFEQSVTKNPRWISVGIGFSNQSADGTDAR